MQIIGHADVERILAGRELEIAEIARDAYRRHENGLSVLPHSTFLRFPDDAANRIIALPAYLGGDRPSAGVKWISSFPANTSSGMPRASAAIVLNATDTGLPTAMIEGSQISAKRTAASAAVAALELCGDSRPRGVSLIGCGVINLEVLRFLAVVFPELDEVTLCDADSSRLTSVVLACTDIVPNATVRCVPSTAEAVAAQPLVSIATTASQPHMNLDGCQPGSTVLHISLRDLYPQTILTNRNVVDDPDHVCRERTSLDLAARITLGRGFIDATLGQLLNGAPGVRRDPAEVVIFSPFGLGVLDIAVAEFVVREATEAGLGHRVDDFLPSRALDGAAR